MGSGSRALQSSSGELVRSSDDASADDSDEVPRARNGRPSPPSASPSTGAVVSPRSAASPPPTTASTTAAAVGSASPRSPRDESKGRQLTDEEKVVIRQRMLERRRARQEGEGGAAADGTSDAAAADAEGSLGSSKGGRVSSPATSSSSSNLNLSPRMRTAGHAQPPPLSADMAASQIKLAGRSSSPAAPTSLSSASEDGSGRPSSPRFRAAAPEAVASEEGGKSEAPASPRSRTIGSGEDAADNERAPNASPRTRSFNDESARPSSGGSPRPVVTLGTRRGSVATSSPRSPVQSPRDTSHAEPPEKTPKRLDLAAVATNDNKTNDSHAKMPSPRDQSAREMANLIQAAKKEAGIASSQGLKKEGSSAHVANGVASKRDAGSREDVSRERPQPAPRESSESTKRIVPMPLSRSSGGKAPAAAASQSQRGPSSASPTPTDLRKSVGSPPMSRGDKNPPGSPLSRHSHAGTTPSATRKVISAKVDLKQDEKIFADSVIQFGDDDGGGFADFFGNSGAASASGWSAAPKAAAAAAAVPKPAPRPSSATSSASSSTRSSAASSRNVSLNSMPSANSSKGSSPPASDDAAVDAASSSSWRTSINTGFMKLVSTASSSLSRSSTSAAASGTDAAAAPPSTTTAAAASLDASGSTSSLLTSSATAASVPVVAPPSPRQIAAAVSTAKSLSEVMPVKCAVDDLSSQQRRVVVVSYLKAVKDVLIAAGRARHLAAECEAEWLSHLALWEAVVTVDCPERSELQLRFAEYLYGLCEFRVLCELPQYAMKAANVLSLIERGEGFLRDVRSQSSVVRSWSSGVGSLQEQFKQLKFKAIFADSSQLAKLATELQGQVKETARLKKALSERAK